METSKQEQQEQGVLWLLLAGWALPLFCGILIYLGWVAWRHPLFWVIGGLVILFCSPIALGCFAISFFKRFQEESSLKMWLVRIVLLSNFPMALLLILYSSSLIPRLSLEIENRSGSKVVIESFEITGVPSPGFTLDDGETRSTILYPQIESESFTIRFGREGEIASDHDVGLYVTNGLSEERASVLVKSDLELQVEYISR